MIDEGVVQRIGRFYRAVNERSEWLAGLRGSYDPPDEALGPDVEYFHPVITYDDRMRYICEHVALNPDHSDRNRLCNIIISHFYGARGIHQVLTAEKDPRKAMVDFEAVSAEPNGPYVKKMREISVGQKAAGLPFWGTTELHSSIQAAGKRYVSSIDGEQTPFAVCEWIANWIRTGTVDRMLSSSSFEELYREFRKIPGVGAYYGYHGAAGVSNMPTVRCYHDERFCEPGPGAVETALLMAPGTSKKEWSPADRVIWLRENAGEYFELPVIHPSRHNVVVDGTPIYPEPQDGLKTYGTEVLMCQFSVYERLRNNPRLISKRKISHLEDNACLSSELFS